MFATSEVLLSIIAMLFVLLPFLVIGAYTGKTHFNQVAGYQYAGLLARYNMIDTKCVNGVPMGNVFFVNSNTGTDSTSFGFSPEAPFDTIDYAVSQCIANNNDYIVVLPGHTETVAAANGIDLDINGITVVGIGSGDERPLITLGTATTATVRVNAKNVTIRNLRFTSAIDSLVKVIDVNNHYCTIQDCHFVGASTFEILSFINLATTFDYLTVERCLFEQGTDPAGTDGGADTGGIYCVDSEHIYIADCKFIGNFETAAVHNRTTACKYLVMERCYVYSALSGSEPLQLVANAIGVAKECFFHTPAETAAVEATLYGTLGDKFFIAASTSAGNDGAAGGQGGIAATAAS